MNTEIINQLPAFEDDSGVLHVLEFKDIPFVPKRMFYVSQVPAGEYRGFHAHIECQQLLICLSGRIDISLDKNGDGCSEYYGLGQGMCLFVDKMVWAHQLYLWTDSVLMVVCSHEYDAEDYINDFNVFTAWKKDPSKIQAWKRGALVQPLASNFKTPTCPPPTDPSSSIV